MTSEAYAAQYADAVERSFRDDAIRTAVLIDDQFPDYLQMQSARVEDFRDLDRARALYGFLHQRGLLCDVQNWRGPKDADLTLLDKIRKSDLIVLDYQLGRGPEAALSILRHLAVSAHFNLVVLYTSDPLRTVALATVSAMRGLATLTPGNRPSEELLDDAREILGRDEFKEIDQDALVTYLKTGTTPWIADLRTAMEEAGLNLAGLRPLADHVGRAWIAQLHGDYEAEAPVLDFQSDLSDENALWIRCGSCFVAIVGKGKAGKDEAEGDYVWRRLGQALRNWRPNVYRLILSEIQNTLELEAIVDHEAWLDDNLCLGLGLYLLESERVANADHSREDIAGSAHALIDRFVDLIRRRLATQPRIVETASDLLFGRLSLPANDHGEGENARHTRARELAHIAAEEKVDWSKAVVPTVNAFMVSDAFRGSHLTTGTVLRDARNGYWLTMSPACDLVPRESGLVGLQMMQLLVENSGVAYTQGDKVVIVTDRGPVILRALNEKTRQPKLSMLLLPGGSRVALGRGKGLPTVEGWFAAELAKAGAAPAPLKLTVVSQLRASFATRFLMVTGQHLSRVGVDFIDP